MSYLWILIVGCFTSFAVMWGIGANDLANSFGTAYGSKVLTLKQIVVIAAFCEFGGALLLGGEVAKTVAGNLTASDAFTPHPYIFMYGMLAAIIATAFWLFFATAKKLPVSTTHSIVGAVVGFALVFKGGSGIKWAESSDEFPFVKGVVPIFISWLTSPLLSMVITMLVFGLLRTFVLRETGGSAGTRTAVSFVITTFVTMWVNTFFILSKGMKKRVQWPIGQSAWVATVISVGISICVAVASPKLVEMAKRQTEEDEKREQEEAAERMRGALENWNPEDRGTKAAEEHELELQHKDADASPSATATAAAVGANEPIANDQDSDASPSRNKGRKMPKTRGASTVAEEMQKRQNNTDEQQGSSAFVAVQNDSVSQYPNSALASTSSNLRARKPAAAASPTATDENEPSTATKRSTTDANMPASALPTTYSYATSSYAGSDGRGRGPKRYAPLSRKGSFTSTAGGVAPSAAVPSIAGSIARTNMTNQSMDAMSEVLPPHDEVEIFHPHAEWLFRYLQIFSAMVISFSHGANTISNSVGALAAIYWVYDNGSVSNEVEVEIWLLAVGGVGIVLGLATMGRKIMEVLGEDMVVLTPSRGFSAQFAASLVVSFSSSYGLPVSTTHCVTGAVIGIGLVEGASHVDWNVVGRTAVGWIVTVVVTAFIAGLFFAQGIYAPSSDIAFGKGD